MQPLVRTQPSSATQVLAKAMGITMPEPVRKLSDKEDDDHYQQSHHECAGANVDPAAAARKAGELRSCRLPRGVVLITAWRDIEPLGLGKFLARHFACCAMIRGCNGSLSKRRRAS